MDIGRDQIIIPAIEIFLKYLSFVFLLLSKFRKLTTIATPANIKYKNMYKKLSTPQLPPPDPLSLHSKTEFVTKAQKIKKAKIVHHP